MEKTTTKTTITTTKKKVIGYLIIKVFCLQANRIDGDDDDE